jgi:hypothetical protein
VVVLVVKAWWKDMQKWVVGCLRILSFEVFEITLGISKKKL